MKGTAVHTRSRVASVGLVAGLLLVLTALVAPSARADAPAQDPKASDFEVDFMTDMIDHHAMAVMMGRDLRRGGSAR